MKGKNYRLDPDETAGRRLYRSVANALANSQIRGDRRVSIEFSPPSSETPDKSETKTSISKGFMAVAS